MSTRWHPLKHSTVNDNRCATDVNTLATDGHSLQGARVVRPLTVSGPGPDTTLSYSTLGFLLLLYTQLISFWCRWTKVPTTLVCRLLLPGNGITAMITLTGFDFSSFYYILGDFQPLYEEYTPYTDNGGISKINDTKLWSIRRKEDGGQ